MKFQPSEIWGSAGTHIHIKLQERGEDIPIRAKNCVIFTSPDRDSARIIEVDLRSFPIAIRTIKDDPNAWEIIITGDHPAFILYRDPDTDETAAVNVGIVPPHNHRDVGRGGPAVDNYDVFKI